MNQRLLKLVTVFLSGNKVAADYLVGGGTVTTRRHHYHGLYKNGFFIIADDDICEDVFKVKV